MVWKMLLTLLSLGLISKLSGFRTPVPASLEQATFFSPLHLFESWWGRDAAARAVLEGARLQRPGLWQDPWLVACLGLHLLLTAYFLRKS
ncbi:MAG: hypothetical protein IT573_09975 [Deltaproteobacteria bacterium]|nr:hypothetical protein [Deltaproteobacteria bacterium]